MEEMPIFETTRLFIRPLEMMDLDKVYRLFDLNLGSGVPHHERMETKAERLEWFQWSILNYRQLAKLNQPHYGDRAITLKSTGTLIGPCGFVPCLNTFEQMPNIDYYNSQRCTGRYLPEFGLFYAISPSRQRKGYATEATQALIDYAFRHIHLKRIIATTDYNNAGSGVMRKLGMRLENNPLNEPPWLQVVGTLENENTYLGGSQRSQ
jgi:ribosomal-protein-alanine N-acetyltransferase